MKLYLPLLLILFFHKGYSQTYTSGDYATAADSFLITTAYPDSSINYSATGNSFTWDFSDVEGYTQKFIHYDDQSSPVFKNIYTASCKDSCTGAGGTGLVCTNTCNTLWNNYTNLSRPSVDSIDLYFMEITGGRDFLKNTATGLTQHFAGYNFEIGGAQVPLLIEYSGTDKIYTFPNTFGTTDSSSYSFSIDLNEYGVPLSYYTQRKRVNVTDGAGMIITPHGVYGNTIRIRSVLTRKDSIQIDTVSLSQGVMTSVIYTWLDASQGMPVFEAKGVIVNGEERILSLHYIDSIRCFQPTALFSYSPVELYLSGTTDSVEVKFENQSINAETFIWDPGDGSSMQGQNPTHFYHDPGTYSVSLFAFNALCNPMLGDTIMIPVVIIDSTKVNADFKSLPSYPCASSDDSVRFINKSINSTAWNWNFGDGSTSILKNPAHVYSTPGTYTVTLIARKTTAPVTSDTVEKEVIIYGPPVADAGSNITINEGESTTLMASGGNNAIYRWWPEQTLSCAYCESPTATPDTTTMYYLKVYDLCGVSEDSVLVTVDMLTSIHGMQDMVIDINPNPASGSIFLKARNHTGKLTVKIIDLTGKVVMHNVYASGTSVNMESISAGVYLVKVSDDAGRSVTRKLIRQE